MNLFLILYLALFSALAEQILLSANPDLLYLTANRIVLWGSPDFLNSFTNDVGSLGSPDVQGSVINDLVTGVKTLELSILTVDTSYFKEVCDGYVLGNTRNAFHALYPRRLYI